MTVTVREWGPVKPPIERTQYDPGRQSGEPRDGQILYAPRFSTVALKASRCLCSTSKARQMIVAPRYQRKVISESRAYAADPSAGSATTLNPVGTDTETAPFSKPRPIPVSGKHKPAFQNSRHY